MAGGYFFNFDKMAYIKGGRHEECILCAIRDRASWVVNLSVAEGPHTIACMNLYPFNPGHLMVFPSRHVQDLRELHSEESADMHRCTTVLLDILEREYGSSAFNIGYNMGRVAGASIEHLHEHIIPRYPREIGMADIIAGKRVLVENPNDSALRIRAAVEKDGRLSPRD